MHWPTYYYLAMAAARMLLKPVPNTGADIGAAATRYFRIWLGQTYHMLANA